MPARLALQWGVMLIASLFAVPGFASGDEFEQEPINYSQRTPHNRVSQLFDDIQAGRKSLEYESHFGFLPALLRELEVPVSSQTLVFSKTSLQRSKIAPRTPRSLYFNDDVYVGFCQFGDVLEISAADPELGTVFYTVDQYGGKTPQLKRQTDDCLICHGSAQTRDIPGHLLRSVFTSRTGEPILSLGTFRIDQTSPLEERWGGWYVTGQHGGQKHLGNLITSATADRRDIDNTAGLNVTDLSPHIDCSRFLTPHSDLVALLVLEHQTGAHNRLTAARFKTLQALHYERALNLDFGNPPEHRWPSTNSRIRSVGEPLVEYLLCSKEAPLQSPVSGTSTFAADFSRPGPRDSQGRSLRDLDLQTRLFKYPCSYLVYSPSFQHLPGEMKDYVSRRFEEILSGKDQSKPFQHLTAADRQAIREILDDTRWLTPAPVSGDAP